MGVRDGEGNNAQMPSVVPTVEAIPERSVEVFYRLLSFTLHMKCIDMLLGNFE